MCSPYRESLSLLLSHLKAVCRSRVFGLGIGTWCLDSTAAAAAAATQRQRRRHKVNVLSNQRSGLKLQIQRQTMTTATTTTTTAMFSQNACVIHMERHSSDPIRSRACHVSHRHRLTDREELLPTNLLFVICFCCCCDFNLIVFILNQKKEKNPQYGLHGKN